MPAGLRPIAERAAHVGRYIEATDVDVVTFQEVWQRRSLRVLGSSHPSLRYVRWCRGLARDFNTASDCPLYPAIVDGGAWRDPFADTDPLTFRTEFLPPGVR